MFRVIFFGGMLVAAAVGPVALFSAPEAFSKAKKAVADFVGSGSASQNPESFKNPQIPSVPDEPTTLDVEGRPNRTLAEVFRFNINSAWIAQNWPRVSTGLADVQLNGYRVNLITGTGRDDLAGSLTYYFDSRRQTQLITFYGTTGDPKRLINFVARHYGFQRRNLNGAALIYLDIPVPDGKSRSVLQIRPTNVIRLNQPLKHFEVSLVLERPNV